MKWYQGCLLTAAPGIAAAQAVASESAGVSCNGVVDEACLAALSLVVAQMTPAEREKFQSGKLSVKYAEGVAAGFTLKAQTTL